MSARIHLDYASSTPLLPGVRQAMVTALDRHANPSSPHLAGQQARLALEKARQQVAALINAKPVEVYFTSCGTESNNWAIKGLLAGNRRKGNHLIVSAIDHPSISLVARRLEADAGVAVTTVPVDKEGRVNVEAVHAALRPETALVSIMLANGEVGTIQPIKEIAALAKAQGALVHTDAIAAVGHWPVDVRALGVDALSLAGSAFYGPTGAAALFVREGVRILPLLEGGGQETGGRSGTEALPAIIGMGVAAELATHGMVDRVSQLTALRNRLRDGLASHLEPLRINGSWSHRLPHNVHICLDGVSSESLVLGLEQAGLTAGLGSACNSKAMRPSHVLKAMGLTDDEAMGALVLTVGVPTTPAEVDQAIELIPQVAAQIRSVAALTMR